MFSIISFIWWLRFILGRKVGVSFPVWDVGVSFDFLQRCPAYNQGSYVENTQFHQKVVIVADKTRLPARVCGKKSFGLKCSPDSLLLTPLHSVQLGSTATIPLCGREKSLYVVTAHCSYSKPPTTAVDSRSRTRTASEIAADWRAEF